ncbi:uncharacterized protein EV420DRAFT_1481710 [Desarmillaria tabescens]|uniref:Uncharacterized protein n=1 Tax=Armillaria tabescens TaxID=1929756 RepID=A0AA39N1I8_ARMTA|nr:uncharacterized protein EV420DRAFT_1481710 [Desarmillaria tabescens]KAK0453979.1 hypothetical protein EV420DRAFT_1481710 [Desarmillaria tabescens]
MTGKLFQETTMYNPLYPYPCIRHFTFLRQEISRHPSYQQFLNIGKEHQGVNHANIRSCSTVGNNVQKAVVDGYPVQQAIATDLYPEFWDLGHKLFKSIPESILALFIPADIFELKDLVKQPIVSNPKLSKVQSSTELSGNISAIHELELTEIMAGLLSSTPGSMIFSSHRGNLVREWYYTPLLWQLVSPSIPWPPFFVTVLHAKGLPPHAIGVTSLTATAIVILHIERKKWKKKWHSHSITLRFHGLERLI